MCTASTFLVGRLCLIKHEIIMSVPPRKCDVSAKLCENASPLWLTSPSVEGEGREKPCDRSRQADIARTHEG